METIIDLIFLALTLVMVIETVVGVKNLSKSPVKVYLLDIVCGVIIGCLLGYLRNDFSLGLTVGIFIGLLFVLVGAVSRWQRRLFTELEQKQTEKNEK